MTSVATPQRTDGEDAIIQARTVVNAVQMSMDSQDPHARAEAEAALRGWESDAAPGFLHSLLGIASQASSPNLSEVNTILADSLHFVASEAGSLLVSTSTYHRSTCYLVFAARQTASNCPGKERSGQLLAQNAWHQGVVAHT